MYFLTFSQKNQKISWLFCYITLAFCMLLNWIQLQPESKRTDVIRREERKSYWTHRCINSIHVQILWLSLRIRANLETHMNLFQCLIFIWRTLSVHEYKAVTHNNLNHKTIIILYTLQLYCTVIQTTSFP